MTWQRIDEDTYIDDTLVTCAEYQLFIDEMLEQGKYYQPDHWTSYQFQSGQSREPVLGMRYSDAVAFCEWLTNCNIGEYKYRLPVVQEIQSAKVKCSLQIGTWTGDKDNSFIWIDKARKNARALVFGEIHILHRFVKPLIITSLENANVPLEDFFPYRNFAHEIEPELDRVSALNIDYTASVVREYTKGSRYMLDYALYFESELLIALNEIVDRSHTYTRPQTINLVLSRLMAFDQNIALAFDSTVKQSLDFEFAVGINNLMNVYIDLLTLQERIAGRSPTFEGIRLVKERIK